MWPPESFSFSCSHRIGTYAPRIRPLFLFSRSAGVRPAKSCRQEAFDQWAVTQGCRMHQRRSPCPPNSIKAGPGDIAGLLREPRIAYSAELSVVTKEFAHSRSSLEEILDRHRGYVAKLRMVGQPSGSVLSATLRVPSSEYRSALTELKGVGLVDHEEEAADEITQQHGELEARLVNAQNEEQRLLRKRFLLPLGRRHLARRDDWSETSQCHGQRSVRRFREHLHHPAVFGRPRSAAGIVGSAALFSRAILLAPAVPVGLQGSRIS